MEKKQEQTICTFDIETNGLLENATTVWCAAIKDFNTGKVYSYLYNNITNFLAKLDTYDVAVGHNCLAFDFPVLKKVYGYEYEGRKVDTLWMSRMQRPNRPRPPGMKGAYAPHSVEAWGYRLGKQKVEHEDWTTYSPNMLDRVVQDVEIQHLILKELIKEGEGENWTECHRSTARIFDKLQRQKDYGWRLDTAQLNHCISLLDHWITRIDNAINPILPCIVKRSKSSQSINPFLKSGDISKRVHDYFVEGNVFNVGGEFSKVEIRKINLDKPDEVKEYLLSLGWKPSKWNTNNKGEITSPKLSKDDDFEGVSSTIGKLLVRRVQCKQRKGVIVGWMQSIDRHDRIPTPVNGIASTGRLRHGSVVNVPGKEAFFGKEMRKCFVPSGPDWIIIGVDSKSNQIRQLAARMGDEEYKKRILYGEDPHNVTMSMCKLPSRTVAKNLFYGTIFGAGDAKAGSLVHGGREQGAELRSLLFSGLPGLQALIERETHKWDRTAKKKFNPKTKRVELCDGRITGLDGRPIIVPSRHMVLVYLLQSDEAIQMGYAYLYIWDEMAKRGYRHGRDWGMLIWYHDEIQFEINTKNVSIDDATQIAKDSIAVAGRYYKINCPHEGDVKIGRSWYETH